jgi:ribose 5-phosphate isomerase A
MSDLQTQMKHAVATAAVAQIRDGMVLGLGSGSTAALMIEELGARLKRGELRDITGVTTSFQGEVLASELGIPLQSLNAIQHIDLAIDGADEVDPALQLIKGGGACHVQEKLVARRADRFVVVVDATKLVNTLNLGFLLPVEVLPGAWRQVKGQLKEMGGDAELRMAVRKAGPVVTDQGNLVLDQQSPRCAGERPFCESHRPGVGGRNCGWCGLRARTAQTLSRRRTDSAWL